MLHKSYQDGSCIAFAIGGEYRDSEDPRGGWAPHGGITLFGLATSTGPQVPNLPAVHMLELRTLVTGDHPGRTEARTQCTRKSDGVRISEFNGQSAVTYFRGEFYIYTRANPAAAGWRSVQVCRGNLNKFGPFELVSFEGVPGGSDIYFLHPYVFPNKNGIFAMLSFVGAPGHMQTMPAGIFCAVSGNGVHFKQPFLLHECESWQRRAYDIPAQGIEFLDTGIEYLVHKNVPCRMSPTHHDRKEGVVSVHHPLPKYMRGLLKYKCGSASVKAASASASGM